MEKIEKQKSDGERKTNMKNENKNRLINKT